MNPKESKSNLMLPALHSYEEYELFKKNNAALEKAVQKIIYLHQLPDGPLTLFSEGTNIVFAHGKHRVIKIFPPFHQDQFKSELLVLRHLQGKLTIQTPTVEFNGEISGWPYLVMNQLDGTLLETVWEKMDFNNKIIVLHELGALIKEVHSLPIYGLQELDPHWEEFIDKQKTQCVQHHRSKHLSENLLQQIPEYLASVNNFFSQISKQVLLTGEYTPMNLLVKQVSGLWHISGMIDFGDAMLGLPEYDLLGPGAFLIQGDKQLLREFLSSYGFSPNKITNTLSHQLTALMLLHRYSNLDIQIRIKDWQSKVKNLVDLERLVWGL